MSKEGAPLQYDLFTRDLVDNRTITQKRADRQRECPQQTEMFPQREVALFGVRAHPQMSLSPHTKLVLVAEDPRTPEEIERDLQCEAEALTTPMFSSSEQPAEHIVYEAKPLTWQPPTVIGYRLQARQARSNLRRRESLG